MPTEPLPLARRIEAAEAYVELVWAKHQAACVRRCRVTWFNDSPEGREALDEARAELDRSEQRLCASGQCVEFIDPLTGKNIGGWGPVGCGCQS